MTTRAHPHPFQRQATASATTRKRVVFWLLRGVHLHHPRVRRASSLRSSFTRARPRFSARSASMATRRSSTTTSFSPSRRRSTSSSTRARSSRCRRMQFYAFQGQPDPAADGRNARVSAATPAPAVSTTGVDANDITEHETYSYAAGGIWPQIVGTVLLVIGSMTIALVLGVFSAIYLSEYSRRGRSSALSASPSSIWPACPRSSSASSASASSCICFGGTSRSWRAGSRSRSWCCPSSSRPARNRCAPCRRVFAKARSRSARQVADHPPNVLPYALPGILTSSVLGIARVAGETAPILFTAAYATSDKLPWEMAPWPRQLSPGLPRLPRISVRLAAPLRLQRRQRVALSHLRRKLQNSAERIHRARAVRHRFRLPRRGHGHRARLRPSPHSPAQTTQMVSRSTRAYHPTTYGRIDPHRPNCPRLCRRAPLPLTNADKVARLNAPTIIDIDNVDFYYGPSKALHGINFPIKEKLVTAFIGPSGCGKSTLLRCLNRMNDLIDGTRIGARLDQDFRASISTIRPWTSSSCASASAWCSRSRIRFRNRSTRTSSTACACRASTTKPGWTKRSSAACAAPRCGRKCETGCTPARSVFPAASSSAFASPAPSRSSRRSF